MVDIAMLAAVGALAILAGATASVVGFGIGSLLTPLVATRYGVDVAIASVALPHLAAGVLRGSTLRRFVDVPLLLRFGSVSAAGGLVGAFLFSRLGTDQLARVLGALLVATGISGVTGWAERWSAPRSAAWALGGVSGFFGGVVGNQGGVRAAALSTFRLDPAVFVETSTLTGVLVDLARTPVYLARAGHDVADIWSLVLVAIVGVLIGTLIGARALLGLSRERFGTIVAVAVGALGVWFLARGA